MTATTKHSFESMHAAMGQLFEQRKDHGYMQAMMATKGFWYAIEQQFCPQRREGDVLLIPGGMYHFAVREKGLIEAATPTWVVWSDALAGDLVYFVPGGSNSIMRLGMAESNQSMQAMPVTGSRLIHLEE